MQQLGISLQESTHVGAEYVDALGRTYDRLGTPAASRFWNATQFTNSIATHLLKSNDFTVVDLTGFTPAQIADVNQYLGTLSEESASPSYQGRVLMAVIVNHVPRGPEDVWQVARWAFAWLLRQAMAECGDDSRTALFFESALALDGLHLHLLDADEADAARKILLEVASRAANGELPPVEVDGRVLDDSSQRQFRVAASDLVRLLR
jgi:hypothetical protein